MATKCELYFLPVFVVLLVMMLAWKLIDVSESGTSTDDWINNHHDC